MRERAVRAALLMALAGMVAWFWILRSRAPAELEPRSFAAGEEFESPARLVFRSPTDTIVVSRVGDGYRITQPIDDRASEVRIKDIARSARTLQAVRILSPDTGSYGLNPPRSVLTLEAGSGATWSIELGDSTAVGAEVYARVPEAGESVFLVRHFTARRDFFPDLSGLRDLVALPLSSPVVDSIHVWTPRYPLRARRVAMDFWIAIEPAGLDLDPLPLNRALRELRGPVLRGFEVDTEARAAGLDPPRARWIVFQGSRTETVAIGNFVDAMGKEVYCRPAGRNAVARMNSDFYRDLVDGWPALARQNLVNGAPDSITSLQFLEGGDRGGYRRDSPDWIRTPSGVSVRAAEALQVDLSNLTKLRWLQYPVERARPDGTRLTLRLGYPAAAETLWFRGTPGDSIAWCRSSLRDRWGSVAASQFRIWDYRASHPEM